MTDLVIRYQQVVERSSGIEAFQTDCKDAGDRGALCRRKKFSADGIFRVSSVGVYMEGSLKTESRI